MPRELPLLSSHTLRPLPRWEYCQSLCSEEVLVGVLHDSVDERSSFPKMHDVGVSVELSPSLWCGLSELELRSQAGSPAATALGTAMT